MGYKEQIGKLRATIATLKDLELKLNSVISAAEAEEFLDEMEGYNLRASRRDLQSFIVRKKDQLNSLQLERLRD